MDFRLLVCLAIQLFCITSVRCTCTWRSGNCHTLKCIEETGTSLNFSQISQNHIHNYDYIESEDFDADPIQILTACLNLDISHSHITTLTNKTFIDVHHRHEYRQIKMIDVNLATIESNTFASFGNVTHLILSKNLLKTVNFLDGLTSLEELDVSYNALHSIGTQPIVLSLRMLFLSNNNLTDMNLCSFPNLIQIEANNNELETINLGCNKKLMTLNLNSNRIQNLNGSSFGNLIDLESLLLSNNIIDSSDGAFQSLVSLRYLYLENNRFVALNRTTFTGLINLKSLTLDNNRIVKINSHSFNQLNSLTHLGLTNNLLSFLHNGSFYGLTGLVELDLSRHNIYILHAGAFSGLTNLNKLDLSNSEVKFIDPDAFLGVPNLKELNLNYNSFHISSFSFANLKKLEKLHLKVDYNYEISSDAFFGLHSLTELDLTDLNITKLYAGCFNGLDNLSLLNLSGNSLVEVESETFVGLPKLIKLDLSYNKISAIDPNAFYELNGVTEFIMTNNNLTTLTANSFIGLAALIHLDLSDSNVQKIENYAFKGLYGLTKLDLSRNNLDSFANPDSLHVLVNLEDLDLSHNNFEVITETTFRGLPNIKFINLEENQIDRINARAFVQVRSLRMLVLSKNKLKQLGVDVFNSQLKTLVLHQNLLKNLPKDSFGNVTNLNEIDLSFNKLTSFDPTVLTASNLVVLNLGHNLMTTLESKALIKAFPNLKTLVIQGNRFPCDAWQEMLSPLSELEDLNNDLFTNVSCTSPYFPRGDESGNYEKLIEETNEKLKVLMESQNRTSMNTNLSETKVSSANVFEIILIVICFAFCAVKLTTWSKKYFFDPRRNNLRSKFVNTESHLELANQNNF